ncbi:unnamed protein product, partial [marine sediment metagenome]
GRGFAVVAEEIRKLALESANSVERVSQLINSTRDGIKEVAKMIDEDAKKAGDGKTLVDKSEKDFEQISKTVTLVTTLINQVNESTGEQNEGTKKLVSVVEKIASIASDTTATGNSLNIMNLFAQSSMTKLFNPLATSEPIWGSTGIIPTISETKVANNPFFESRIIINFRLLSLQLKL